MMAGTFYLSRRSPLHRLDPRPKLFLLLAALCLAVASEGPWMPAGVLVAAMGGVAVARAWPALVRVRALIVILFLFSVAVWSLLPLAMGRSADGTRPAGERELAPAFDGGSLLPARPVGEPTGPSRGRQQAAAPESGGKPPHAKAGLGGARQSSLLVGVATGLKLVAMVVCSVLFLATTRNEELTLGLIRLGVPYPAAFAFATALRLVPALVGTAVTIIQAQKVRGLDAEAGSWLARARKHVPLLVPILASTLRSTQTFAMALEARGFRAHKERTSLLTLRLTAADWAATALAAALLALAGALWAIGA